MNVCVSEMLKVSRECNFDKRCRQQCWRMNENDDQQHSSTSYKSNIKWAVESIANIQVPAN